MDGTRTVDPIRPGGGENHSKSMAPPNLAAGESRNRLEPMRNAPGTARSPSSPSPGSIGAVSTSHSVSR